MMMTTDTLNQIKTAFAQMQTKEDLLHLLNQVKPLVYGEKAVPFQLKQLTYHAYALAPQKRYTSFAIKKKSGAERIIHAPVPGLKAIQKTLAFLLQCVFEPHKAAMGFVKNKCIVDNARLHVQMHYVYNIDLKDFFPSIDRARVRKVLTLPPFHLNQEAALNGDRAGIANLIAALCCHEMEVERMNAQGEWERVRKFVLPQGAPTSPVLTNVICQRLDFLLTGLAKRFGLRYSRYADDITFSSLHQVYQSDGAFLKELQRIITEQGFHIKASKTRLQKEGYRQEVTGLIVNEQVNVQKRYIKQLRKWLYYMEHYGYEKASRIISTQYASAKGEALQEIPKIERILEGKLQYLRMVKGAENASYQKLKNRFDVFFARKVPSQRREQHLVHVLELLCEQGLDVALQEYKPLNK